MQSDSSPAYTPGLRLFAFPDRPAAAGAKEVALQGYRQSVRGANPEYAIVYLGWAFIDSGVPAITHTARPRNNVLHAKCEAPGGVFRACITPS